MEKKQKEILNKVKKITGCDYDLSKHSLWDIAEDLIYEIEELKNTIKIRDEEIENLKNPPTEDFNDSRYEYGY